MSVTHMLKLYPNQNLSQPLSKKPVVSESYDEIVFINPKPEMMEMLKFIPEVEGIKMDEEQSSEQKDVDVESMAPSLLLKYYQPHLTIFDEAESYQSIEKALNLVSNDMLLETKRKVS